jgi:hypothetical protein
MAETLTHRLQPVYCARPGCGRGYPNHDLPGGMCAGFLWVPPAGPITHWTRR